MTTKTKTDNGNPARTMREVINAKALDARPFEHIDVPEWGPGPFKLMGMTSADRDDWERETGIAQGNIDTHNFRALTVAKCLVDSRGVRIFDDEHQGELGQQSALLIGRLYRIAARLSGIGRWADTQPDLVKNSNETGGGNSS